MTYDDLLLKVAKHEQRIEALEQRNKTLFDEYFKMLNDVRAKLDVEKQRSLKVYDEQVTAYRDRVNYEAVSLFRNANP